MAVATDQAEPEVGEQTRVLTTYVVLVQVHADPPLDNKAEHYRLLPGTYEAHNKSSAMRQAAKKDPQRDDGELHRYRAVAVSSWKGGLGIKTEMVEQETVEEFD